MKNEIVLELAGELLALRPAATMDEIAAAAGISRATLFRRFASRDALVHELCDLAVQAYVKTVHDAQLGQGDPLTALKRLAENLAVLAPRYGLLALQPLTEQVEWSLLLRANGADDDVRALIVRGQSEGVFRVDLPAEWLASTMTWIIVGAADGLRAQTVAPADVGRLVSQTVLAIASRRES